MKSTPLVFWFGTLGLWLLQVAAHFGAKTFVDVPWQLSTGVLVLLLATAGAFCYRMMRGSIWVRLALVAAMPALANVLFELSIGSDPAYPNLVLWLIIPYSVACLVGAMVMAFWSREKGRRTRTTAS